MAKRTLTVILHDSKVVSNYKIIYFLTNWNKKKWRFLWLWNCGMYNCKYLGLIVFWILKKFEDLLNKNSYIVYVFLTTSYYCYFFHLRFFLLRFLTFWFGTFVIQTVVEELLLLSFISRLFLLFYPENQIMIQDD